MSLTLEKAKNLMEKIASNQGWSQWIFKHAIRAKKYQKRCVHCQPRWTYYWIGSNNETITRKIIRPFKMLLMLKRHVESIWGLNFLNMKKMQTSSSITRLHSNREKDGNNNNGQLTKVSVQVIILLIPSNHPWESWSSNKLGLTRIFLKSLLLMTWSEKT